MKHEIIVLLSIVDNITIQMKYKGLVIKKKALKIFTKTVSTHISSYKLSNSNLHVHTRSRAHGSTNIIVQTKQK